MAFYCSNCGKPIATDARHCPNCGQAVGGAFQGTQAVPPSGSQRRLVRPRTGRLIAGVCQGVAITYGWDPTLVRVLWIVLTFLGGSGVVAYLVLWLLMPDGP